MRKDEGLNYPTHGLNQFKDKLDGICHLAYRNRSAVDKLASFSDYSAPVEHLVTTLVEATKDDAYLQCS